MYDNDPAKVANKGRRRWTVLPDMNEMLLCLFFVVASFSLTPEIIGIYPLVQVMEGLLDTLVEGKYAQPTGPVETSSAPNNSATCIKVSRTRLHHPPHFVSTYAFTLNHS